MGGASDVSIGRLTVSFPLICLVSCMRIKRGNLSLNAQTPILVHSSVNVLCADWCDLEHDREGTLRSVLIIYE
jgi:hypothetical protein